MLNITNRLVCNNTVLKISDPATFNVGMTGTAHPSPLDALAEDPLVISVVQLSISFSIAMSQVENAANLTAPYLASSLHHTRLACVRRPVPTRAQPADRFAQQLPIRIAIPVERILQRR